MHNKKRVLQLVNEAVKASFSDGRIIPAKVKRLTDAFKKLPASQAIIYLQEYARALKREEEKTILYIQSSIPLSPVYKNKVLGQFKKDHKISSVETKLNPSLKGGILIKIGDYIYEDSIESRIRQLGEAIAGA